MRILYIHQYFTTLNGASGTRSYEFARRLVHRGHEVDLITSYCALPREMQLPFRYRTVIDGIHVHTLPQPYDNLMSFTERLVAFGGFALKASRVAAWLDTPDVVFATSTPLTVGIPGMYAAAKHRCPLVFEVRDLWPEAPVQMGALRNPILRWLARYLERLIYSRSTRIIALSPGIAQGVIGTGVPRSRVEVIPNCADLDLFEPSADGRQLRKREGIGDRFLCLYAGALGRANDVLSFMDVCARLRSQSGIMFALLGDGDQRDAISRHIVENGLGNVHLVGPRPKREVVEWIAASDLGLVLFAPVPIHQTNSPNKFFDYCAGGRPTLINIPGWIADAIRENHCGIVVEDGDPEEMASAILALSQDRSAACRMGLNARRLAEELFDRDKLSLKLESILLAAVDGNPSTQLSG